MRFFVFHVFLLFVGGERQTNVPDIDRIDPYTEAFWFRPYSPGDFEARRTGSGDGGGEVMTHAWDGDCS